MQGTTTIRESPHNLPITEHTVMVTVGINEQEIERRKRLVGIRQEDLDRVAQVRGLVERHVGDLAGAFFEYLREADSRVVMGEELTAHARPLKHEHLLAMVQGRYDLAYVEQRIRLALVYGRFGVETSVFLGAYHQLFANMGRAILRESQLPTADALECFLSLRRVGFFDLSLQIEVLICERERLIREQAQAIRELSTPVLQIRDRLLLMPMIGVIDARRVKLIADRLLLAIRRTRALAVVIDITGVATMEEVVAVELSQAIGASRLMGTSVIITGISELTTHVIRWLPSGADLFTTAGDLQAGIEVADRLLADSSARPGAAETGAARS